MKVLHYSDRSEPNLKELFLSSDALFTTGDLSWFDFVPIEELIQTKVAFGVYGNHDTPGYLEKLGIVNLHLKVYQWHNYTLGGYQGCLRYKKNGGPQFTEAQARKELADFPKVDILLLHAAPYGMLDTPGDRVHQGSHAVREYVERTRPKFVFCGHDSPSQTAAFGQTTVFRTHQSQLIEI